MQPAGQDPEARLVPGAVTLPLRSRTNASLFWIMLLLVWGRLDNGIILFGWPNELAKLDRPVWMTQIAAPVASAHVVGHGVWPLILHLEGGDQRILAGCDHRSWHGCRGITQIMGKFIIGPIMRIV